MNLTRRLVAGGIVVSSIALGAFAQQDVPHLEKRRNVTQLVVDGKPFLILGGELCADLERWANSSVPPCFLRPMPPVL